MRQHLQGLCSLPKALFSSLPWTTWVGQGGGEEFAELSILGRAEAIHALKRRSRDLDSTVSCPPVNCSPGQNPSLGAGKGLTK